MSKGIFIHTLENALGLHDTFDVDIPGEAVAITALLLVVIPRRVDVTSEAAQNVLSTLTEKTFEFGRVNLRAMKNYMFIDKLSVRYLPTADKWNGYPYEKLCKVARPLSFCVDSIRQNIPVGCGVSVMYSCTVDYAADAVAAVLFGSGNYDVKIIMQYSK